VCSLQALTCLWLNVTLCNYLIADRGGVTLFVQTAEFNVLEPELGQSLVITECFIANITQTRSMDDVFEFNLLNSSTATAGVDFFINHNSSLIIPANFTGIYSQCVDIVILGDGLTEGDELIEYSVRPLSVENSVQYAFGSNSLRISIIDNNGKGSLPPRAFLE